MNFEAIAAAVASLGQVDGALPIDAAGGAAQISSVWDFLVKGGPVMIPIALSSLVAFTVVIERLVSLRRGAVLPSGFVPGLKSVFAGANGDKSKALDYCKENPCPLARIFAAGIKRLGDSVASVEKRIQEAGEREVLKLRKHLRLLSVIASIAPLMGLLGTIFGMIIAFQTVATSGEALGKAELLAKGIYQAMITTAAGLVVAIPALLAYHWVCGKIDHLVSEMDALSVEFIEEYVETGGSTGGPNQAVSPPADGAGESVDGDGAITTTLVTV